MNDIQELMLEDLDNVNGGNITENFELYMELHEDLYGYSCVGMRNTAQAALLDKYGIKAKLDFKNHNTYTTLNGESISHAEVLNMIYESKKSKK